MSTRDGFAVRFTYGAAGSLKEIATSRDETLRVDTDDKGRVTAVTLVTDAEETLLVGYRYDENGDMVQTTDARAVSKHVRVRQGTLLTRLTNQAEWHSTGNMREKGKTQDASIHGATEA